LETRIKQGLRGLPIFDVVENIEKMDFTILPFSGLEAQHYQQHWPDNKDPFDNSLVSITLAENLRLMTSDKKILSTPINGLVTIDASRK
jgi:PIN domain nuclease of toxin-antitoxin system